MLTIRNFTWKESLCLRVPVEVSGGSCQRQAAQQANSSLTTFQTQLTHVRQSIAVLQSNIQSDDKAVAVEQERAASTRDCNACAQTLLEASSTFQKLLEDHVGMLGADIAAQERLVADMGTEGSNVSEDESRALKVCSAVSAVYCASKCKQGEP